MECGAKSESEEKKRRGREGEGGLDLLTSRAQIFSRARSARGRLSMFSAAKASERRAGANYRNRK